MPLPKSCSKKAFSGAILFSISVSFISWLLLWIWNAATDQYPTGFAAGWLALFSGSWGVCLFRHHRQKVSDAPPVGYLFAILFGIYFALSAIIYFVAFVGLITQDALGTSIWAFVAWINVSTLLYVWARKEKRRQEDFDELADFNETRCSAPVANLIVVLLCYSFLFFEFTFVAQVVGAAVDRQSLIPPGRRFEVADRDESFGEEMHIHCIGPNQQDPAIPTVLFESAIAAPGISWGLVQEQVASVTTACVYDRKGYGWSWRGTNPRHVDKFVEELHELLDTANVTRPLVGVGWGFGSLVMQKFAAEYGTGFDTGAEVRGLVYVDSLNPGVDVERAEDTSEGTFVDDEFLDSDGPSSSDHFFRFIIPLGFLRMAEETSVSAGSLGFPYDILRLLGEERFEAYRAFLLGYYHSNTVVQEKREWKTKSLEDVEGLFEEDSLDDLPIAVVQRKSDSDSYEEAQDGLLALSSDAVSTTSKEDAYLPMQDPDIVTDAIVNVLARSVVKYEADALAGIITGVKRQAEGDVSVADKVAAVEAAMQRAIRERAAAAE